MKNKLMSLAVMVAAGLLAACTVNGLNEMPDGAQAFPTATNSYLFDGGAAVGLPNSPAAITGAPTVASVFRMLPSATPFPLTTSTPAPVLTQTAVPTAQPFKVLVYGESLNPNWEVQKQTGMTFNLAATGQTYRGNQAISTVPRGRAEAALVFTVSDQSEESYLRDQVTRLSFALYSAKAPLYLDQFSVSILGSNSQPYWSVKDQSVNASGYGSVFPAVHLDELGFDQAIPADTWVLVEIDLDQSLTLEPHYQYVTGISLNSSAGPAHTLLIDDLRLTLLGRPPTPMNLLFTPPASLE